MIDDVGELFAADDYSLCDDGRGPMIWCVRERSLGGDSEVVSPIFLFLDDLAEKYAHLFAAAPEMLAALEKIESGGFMEYCYGEPTDCGSSTITMVKNAIAKAKGQS